MYVTFFLCCQGLAVSQSMRKWRVSPGIPTIPWPRCAHGGSAAAAKSNPCGATAIIPGPPMRWAPIWATLPAWTWLDVDFLVTIRWQQKTVGWFLYGATQKELGDKLKMEHPSVRKGSCYGVARWLEGNLQLLPGIERLTGSSTAEEKPWDFRPLFTTWDWIKMDMF